MESLDPRIQRLSQDGKWDNEIAKDEMDQLETFEVFVQPKESRPYQHEGIVHAPDEEVAFVFAKEQFSRRATCSGIKIVRTSNVFTTDFCDNENSIYNSVEESGSEGEKTYEVYHLMKRGKQHKYAGSVQAGDSDNALFKAKVELDPGKPVYNVWIIASENILESKESDRDIWLTLPEKTFRDATDYRGADKIKKFKEEQS